MVGNGDGGGGEVPGVRRIHQQLMRKVQSHREMSGHSFVLTSEFTCTSLLFAREIMRRHALRFPGNNASVVRYIVGT